MRQAMAALRTAEREDAGIVRWTTLRFDAFRAAARSDRLYARAADLLRSLLFDYDAEHDADLGATAEAFAAAYGEVSRTAEALFQHPNTVRYRLKRAAETTGWDATDPRDAYVLTTALAIGRMRDR